MCIYIYAIYSKPRTLNPVYLGKGSSAASTGSSTASFVLLLYVRSLLSELCHLWTLTRFGAQIVDTLFEAFQSPQKSRPRDKDDVFTTTMFFIVFGLQGFKTGSTGNTGQTHLLLFLRNLANMSRQLALPVSWNESAFPVPLAHLSLMFSYHNG